MNEKCRTPTILLLLVIFCVISASGLRVYGILFDPFTLETFVNEEIASVVVGDPLIGSCKNNLLFF
jgi:hypothetical protein